MGARRAEDLPGSADTRRDLLEALARAAEADAAAVDASR
jgi:hypothetical protein